MKRFVILLLVGLAMSVGYLMGTENGRRQGAMLMEAINRRRGLEAGTGADDEIDLTADDTAAAAGADPVAQHVDEDASQPA